MTVDRDGEEPQEGDHHPEAKGRAIPSPGDVLNAPPPIAPKTDPDRFALRPSLVFAFIFGGVAVWAAIDPREPWIFIPALLVCAWLLMWPRIRGRVDLGGGELPNGTPVPRVRGDVTEPAELSDGAPLPRARKRQE